MDIGAIIGLVIGFVALLVGMMFKGVPFSALNNIAAFFIIIVGTVGAVAIATPGNELKRLPKLFGILFGKPKFWTQETTIETIVEMSTTVRKDGILSLESQISSIEDPFLQRGIQLLVDGVDIHFLDETLTEEMAAMETRHAANAQIFTQAGTYAPTLGVLGAVLGLIAALSDLSDTEALGHAISAAFVATMLGIFTGYVLWFPFANRLKRRSKQEVFIKQLIMEGLIGMAEGQSPRIIKDRMLAFVPSFERERVSQPGS